MWSTDIEKSALAVASPCTENGSFWKKNCTILEQYNKLIGPTFLYLCKFSGVIFLGGSNFKSIRWVYDANSSSITYHKHFVIQIDVFNHRVAIRERHLSALSENFQQQATVLLVAPQLANSCVRLHPQLKTCEQSHHYVMRTVVESELFEKCLSIEK